MHCVIPASVQANNIQNPSTSYNFYSMADPLFLEHIEDNVFEGLNKVFDPDKYIITEVRAKYISKEYLDEIKFNSRKNIYFGHTLAELDAHFEGTRYVFCNDEYGKTIVKKFEAYDDTYEQIAQNVAMGTGVIVVCATVAVIGGPAVSVIFFAAAEGAALGALSDAALEGIPAAIATYQETGDMEATFKNGALAASEGFKRGAIIGAVLGGAAKAAEIAPATRSGLSMNDAVKIHKNTGLSYSRLKKVKSYDEFNRTYRTGGAYGDISKYGGGNGKYEYHHGIADSISKLDRNNGPAIRMTVEDHRATASWGNSAEARAYREQQRILVEQGKWREALQMDIDDITSKFGHKYDKEIAQMLEYVGELERTGVLQ